jgi:hypothetical protein
MPLAKADEWMTLRRLNLDNVAIGGHAIVQEGSASHDSDPLAQKLVQLVLRLANHFLRVPEERWRRVGDIGSSAHSILVMFLWT